MPGSVQILSTGCQGVFPQGPSWKQFRNRKGFKILKFFLDSFLLQFIIRYYSVQQVHFGYLYYIQKCAYVNSSLQIYSPTFSFGSQKFVFCVCGSIFVLYIGSFVSFFRFHIETISWYLSFFFRVTQYDNLQVHPCCCKLPDFIPF